MTTFVSRFINCEDASNATVSDVAGEPCNNDLCPNECGLHEGAELEEVLSWYIHIRH